MNVQNSQLEQVLNLQFDRNNPRLAGMCVSDHTTDEEVIQILWDAMDVQELIMSIQASGFFRHEFLIVEKDTRVVLEGNRRLAAVRLLLEPELLQEPIGQIPELKPSERKVLETVPVVFGTRESMWQYLGFKHINGPAKWSSYAKSCYIATVHRGYGVSLQDIARQIGDTHRTVQRLFQGLMVKEQAEEAKVFDPDDRWYNHFSFSHLYTGIAYQGIRNFLGLESEDEEKERPVPQDKVPELGELFGWLYGSKKESLPPIVQSQNPHLLQLDRILAHPEARETLRARRSLDLALEASRPAAVVFRDSLIQAKRSLVQTRASLTTGYDESVELLTIAGEVANLGYDLYQEMSRIRQPGPQRPVVEHN